MNPSTPLLRSAWARRLRRWVVLCASALLIAYVAAGVLAALLYRKMLYPMPSVFPTDVPSSARLLETIAADGAHVRALVFDPPPGAPVVVYFHGNGETVGHDVWMARAGTMATSWQSSPMQSLI